MKITEVTRRNILDELRLEKISWSGRLEETDFLSRLYDLGQLPSTDGRFSTAGGDIFQHRINNLDWDDYWVFTDSRFGLAKGTDEIFLRFLCEMLHPIVRTDISEVNKLLTLFNKYLTIDGWEVAERTRLSGSPVFAARQLLIGVPVKTAHKVAVNLNAGYVTQQITRMESSVESDPELAIGTAKEFVETVCKTILRERSIEYSQGEDFTGLVKLTLKSLQLAPDDIPDQAKAVKTIRVLLHNLATVAHGLTELRNPYGSGHGKEARSKGLRARHARLAVGAASTLGVFLFETHTEKSSS